MREEARVVIVGGGAMGVGLLYYLAHEGWTDIVLVEKDELTSGSTWHAAGLIPNFIGSLNMAKVHQDAIDLYNRLEAETGMASGFHRSGALRLALRPEHVPLGGRARPRLERADPVQPSRSRRVRVLGEHALG